MATDATQMRPRTRNSFALQAYAMGKRAYRAGLQAYNGPPNTAFQRQWEEGWRDEKRKDLRATAKVRREIENLKVK